MKIKLYNNSSPINYVHKTLVSIGEYDGTLRNATSILNPVININASYNSVASANYAHITEFKRYYFIASITAKTDKLFEIAMKVDALSTYWDYIAQSDCIVSRNEYVRTNDLKDDQILVTADSLYEIIKFPGEPFNVESGADKRYVLLLNGAGSSSE